MILIMITQLFLESSKVFLLLILIEILDLAKLCISRIYIYRVFECDLSEKHSAHVNR